MFKQYTIHNNESKKILCKISQSYLSCGNEYQIWNYDACYLGCNEPISITQCRSVILSHPQKQLLSFSYPKKEPNYNPLMTYCNEFVEGCLVHLFYDNRTSRWEIATKNGIGGHYPVMKTPLQSKKYQYYIRTMFCELMQSNQLNQIACIQDFSKQHCYNFILQHPNICYMQSKKLYLVGVYALDRETNSAAIVPHKQYEAWECFPRNLISFPKTLHILPLAMQHDNVFLEQCEKNDVYGMVCHDYKNGQHYVYKTPSLKEKQKIKHLHHMFLYQYLALKSCNKESFYLQHYPYHRKIINYFHQLVKNCVFELYRHYKLFYVNKKIEKVPIKYKYYLEEIHQYYYLDNLKKKRVTSVDISEVMHYFNNKLNHSQQFYLLLYEKRKACVK